MLAGQKLLVADDSPYYRTVMGLTFTDEGMEVRTAGDGQEALERLDQFAPDVILASVSIPGINGYELCERIKHSERFGHIPVMLLVGLHELFDQAEARRVGADAVVTKPFKSIRELVGRVGSLLGDQPTEAAHQHSTLGLGRGDFSPAPSPDETNMTESDVKVFIEAQAMTEHDAPEAGVHPAGSTCGADVELQTRDTQKLESTAIHDAAHADPPLDHTEVEKLVEAPTTPEHQSSESEIEKTGHTCVADVELQTADTMELERIDDEPVKTETQTSFAPADSREMEAPVQPVAKSDLPLEPRPHVSDLNAPEGNEQKPSHAPNTNDALLDLDDFGTPAPVAVSEDLVLDLDDEYAADEPTSEAAMLAPDVVSEPAPAFETAQVEPMASAQSAVSSPHEEPQASELQGQAELQDWAIVTHAPTEARPEEPVPVAQPQATSDAKTEFSPADVDAIARRVVEQLSEKVVREIAWEVVPELAELLIKQKLDEKK